MCINCDENERLNELVSNSDDENDRLEGNLMALQDLLECIQGILMEPDTFEDLRDAEYSYEELKDNLKSYLFRK